MAKRAMAAAREIKAVAQSPEDIIRETYRSEGTIKGTARRLGITVYAVEKACNVGYYLRRKNRGRFGNRGSHTRISKISETKMLEREDEEERGRKVLKSYCARLREKEYVLDSELRRECRVSSDNVWDKLRAEYPKSVILVGHGANPRAYWGAVKSCCALVKIGKAIFLNEVVN